MPRAITQAEEKRRFISRSLASSKISMHLLLIVARRRLAEQAAVFAAELRGALVADLERPPRQR
jgi:hypothetical protein